MRLPSADLKDPITSVPDVILGPHEIFGHQVEIMVRQARRGAFVALVAIVLVASLLVPSVGWPRVATWAALVALAVGIRSAALMYINRRRHPVATSALWERVLTVSTALMGMCVASGAMIFFPAADFRIRAVVTVILCSWPAGGAAVLGAHPRSYYWYLGCYFPILGLAWLIYEPEYPAVVAMMALFAYVLVFLSKEIGRLVVVSATLEKQKDDLLLEKDSLLSEKDRLIGALDVARRNSDEANLSKSRFLAAASHDLRQPVTAAALLAGVLGNMSLDAKGKVISNQITRALDSLEELFNAILDLSRLDAKAVSPQPTSFDLTKMLQGLVVEYEPRITEKKLALQLDLENVYLRVDRILLERIVRNLLDNAMKFTSAGSITLRLRRLPQGCSLQVEDTGRGIPSEEQQKIFDDFYQLSRSSSTRAKGLGLGLAIVRGFAEVLGIEVAVRSRFGKGSTFEVTFPQTMITSKPHAIAAISAPIEVELRDCVVVVIDDDPLIRDAIKLALTVWQTVPIVAPDLELAIAGLKSVGRAPDLLLVDYNLAADALGTEAIAAIRDIFPGVPALLMTGDSASSALETGEISVLQKPISYTVLAAEISRTLSNADIRKD